MTPGVATPWVLLIYTVPAEPTRKRAFIWREVKKVGAIYVRDGVCILPEGPNTLDAANAIAAKVREFDGEATLVRSARLDPSRAGAVIAQFRAARAAEYADIARDAELLLRHAAHQNQHRAFDVSEIADDVITLKRWCAQVQERDYFPDGSSLGAEQQLARCEAALLSVRESATT